VLVDCCLENTTEPTPRVLVCTAELREDPVGQDVRLLVESGSEPLDVVRQSRVRGALVVEVVEHEVG
jgi:hypothetical protein